MAGNRRTAGVFSVMRSETAGLGFLGGSGGVAGGGAFLHMPMKGSREVWPEGTLRSSRPRRDGRARVIAALQGMDSSGDLLRVSGRAAGRPLVSSS